MTYGMLYKNQVAKEAGWAYQHSTPHWNQLLKGMLLEKPSRVPESKLGLRILKQAPLNGNLWGQWYMWHMKLYAGIAYTQTPHYANEPKIYIEAT